MNKKTIVSLLLLSTLSVTPAFANYFSNPRMNTMLNIGSAPSPTPEQLRNIGDSPYAPSGVYPAPARPQASDTVIAPAPVVLAPIHMRAVDVEYKPVFGVRGERLGTVIGFDENMQRAELQLPTGVAVSMPATLIEDRGGRLVAPTVSHDDVLAMAKTQTGRIVATNMTIRSNTRA
jgi:hypothetical protein